MQKHPYAYILFAFLSFFVISCDSDENKNLSAYVVQKSDFEHTLIVEGFVEPVQSLNISCPAQSQGDIQIKYLIPDGSIVEEGEVICILDSKAEENNRDELALELESAEAELNKTKANLTMQYDLLEAQVKNNETETKIAQLDSLQLKYATPSQKRIRELELQKVAIEKTKLERKLKSLEIINRSEIIKQEMRIQRLSVRLKSVNDKIAELTLKAPKKGFITRAIFPYNNKKIQEGDFVWDGVSILSMPELEQMRVKIQASETDYKYINVKDSVHYTFDAMPENEAYGKISSKAPIGQPHKRDSKVKFFDILASVDSAFHLPQPGFTSTCKIILKQVRDTIVIPQIAVFDVESIKLVYIKKKDDYEMRQVLTGISSPKEVIISAGLNPEEIISLSKPVKSSIGKVTLLPDSIAMKRMENKHN